MLTAKRRRSLYGMHSIERDAAYSNGAGNVLAALQHARGQLSVYPDSAPVLHDVATLQLMSAEQGGAGVVEDAMQRLEAAYSLGAEAWATAEVLATGNCADATAATSASTGPPAVSVTLRSVGSADVLQTVPSAKGDATAKEKGGGGGGGGEGEKVTEQESSIIARDGRTKRQLLRYTERRKFVAELKQVELSGKDGVITAPRQNEECTCDPFIQKE